MRSHKLLYLLAMGLFGTIGLFVRAVGLPSAQIAMYRGAAGAVLLLLLALVRGRRPSLARLRADGLVLLLSGAALGLNWVLLYEAYRYTTVATSTVCYYMAPVFLTLLSPLLFREALSLRRGLCVLAAVAGLACVTGLRVPAGGELRGVLCGLGAAAFYTAVIVLNKRLRAVTGTERAIAQLAVAAGVLLPYVLAGGAVPLSGLDARALLALLAICVVHTAFCYQLFFTCVARLESHTIAVLAYVDPVLAICLSALLLREPFGPLQALGSLLVVGSALISELPARQRQAPRQSLD